MAGPLKGATSIRPGMGAALIGLTVTLASGACAPERPPSEAAGSDEGYPTTATIEEIMRYVVDPAADAIWESVVTDVTPEGVIEHLPETEDDWATLRGHALTLVESTNLLLMPGRRVASADSRSELPGVDLEPEEIGALLAESRPAWDQFVRGLRESGLVVLDASDRRDVDALLVAGDGLDLACENCHIRFWYPSLAEEDTAR